MSGRVTEQCALERLARCMYRDAFRRLDSQGTGDAPRKITLLYGPLLVRPDAFVVPFQGGGEDASSSRRTWPERLLYLCDCYRFGSALRKHFRQAGLFKTLEKRTVAMAACFPEVPASEAGSWMAKSGPKAEWREFSTNWVRRMLREMRPHMVLVFGGKANEALG